MQVKEITLTINNSPIYTETVSIETTDTEILRIEYKKKLSEKFNSFISIGDNVDVLMTYSD